MFMQPGSEDKKRIELPSSEVRKIFSKTAESIGYRPEIAEVLGVGVWNLTNRGIDGVSYAWGYLSAVKKLSSEALEPKPGADGALHCLCPILASCQIIERVLAGGEPAPGSKYVLKGVGAPLMMLPLLSVCLKSLNYDRRATRIQFLDQDVIYDDNALTIDSRSLTGLYMVFAPEGIDVAVSFEESAANSTFGMTFPRQNFESLWIPQNRLRGDGLMDLG